MRVSELIIGERRAREEAETATRLKTSFLTSATHELRTPVSATLLWAKLLTGGRLSDAQVQSAPDAIASCANDARGAGGKRVARALPEGRP
jgi:signal transduction histidine kinase